MPKEKGLSKLTSKAIHLVSSVLRKLVESITDWLYEHKSHIVCYVFVSIETRENLLEAYPWIAMYREVLKICYSECSMFSTECGS
jgi:hypothetical protein